MTSQWTIITVTYNSAVHLARHWSPRADLPPFEWIVVDNASGDESRALAESLGAQVVKSASNLGFSKGNNLGLAHVATEYVAFVNPDISLSDSSWQKRLSTTIDSTGGLVAPQLLNTDCTEQPNARGLPFLAAKIRNRVSPLSSRARGYARTSLSAPTYCAWTMGAALAGRTATFRDIGGWDEAFFLYYEDHEIGLRAWRSGRPVVLDPQVRWIHAWERATKRPNFRAWRAEISSMKIFYSKHPEFLRGTPASPRAMRRVKQAGFSTMCERLWKPVVSE